MERERILMAPQLMEFQGLFVQALDPFVQILSQPDTTFVLV